MTRHERWADYRDEIAVRLCNVLYDLPEDACTLTRFQLAARLFGNRHRGGSILIIAIREMKKHGVLVELPPRFNEPGERYQLTDSGRAQVAFLHWMERSAA